MHENNHSSAAHERSASATNPNPEVLSGRDVQASSIAEVAPTSEFHIELGRANIIPSHIGVGETEIVLQRHGRYIRDRENPNVGSLTPEAIQVETESADRYFTELMDGLSHEELSSTYFLFVASDTVYAGGGMRSYETVSIAQRVAETLLAERDVSTDNILNNSHDLHAKGAPRPMATLREPKMFEKSPDFVQFLSDKYGDLGKDFWVAFEEDREEETRKALGAEGPDEIADRMKMATRALSYYAAQFHRAHPGRRLVVWAGTHYDTISPFIKRDVLQQAKSAEVFVGHGGGVTIALDAQMQAQANINGQKYPVEL